ncbi:ATP-binding protein [Alloscardovia macacae]|uniref:Iron-sulfur cluster carrier protein n=2 Tax=Alloscardovia macacae TaxID=1160091 RepID=A0A261F3G7_9BIFI|nr:ATP-binding protein [Alloscardovia macacae]
MSELNEQNELTEERLAREIYARMTGVIDPELGKSITDLGMVTGVEVTREDEQGAQGADHAHGAHGADHAPAFRVHISIELTVPGCPLSDVIRQRIEDAVTSYPDAHLTLELTVGSMNEEKLGNLVAELKAARRENPFHKPGIKTRVFAVASGKGGVGKSSVTANLAATFAALGYDTAVIDADIYGFSMPKLLGVTSHPTNLNGMLMPVEAWGTRVMSIGMFAGSDQAILWRGPRLQRSLEQFLSDVWWGEPDVLLIDMAPGTGDMAISVAQALPNAELIVVTTPQPSASDIAVRAGLVALQVPMDVAGVVENMSWYDHVGERLRIFGEGGGQRVSDQLTAQLSAKLGHDVPLLAQLPLETDIREVGESGRPAVLNADGSLADSALAESFTQMVRSLMERDRG